MSPARRRDAVRFLVAKRRVSERRACQLVGQNRSTQRYERQPAELELQAGGADERARVEASALRLPAGVGAAALGGLRR